MKDNDDKLKARDCSWYVADWFRCTEYAHALYRQTNERS
jgi:hypothetical protein